MSDIITKLERVKQTKEEIRAAIAAKGASCETDCFREYPERILAIPSGGSSSGGSSSGGSSSGGSSSSVDLTEILKLIGDGKFTENPNWQSMDEIVMLIGGDNESLKVQIQELLDLANNTTGNTDATLTEGVNTLVVGYGQGNNNQPKFTGNYTTLYNGQMCIRGNYIIL